MAFQLVPTYELNDYTFVIPSYQRGYRWGRDQIEALLNDLKEFLESKPEDDTAYYLQPIVVTPRRGNHSIDDSKDGILKYTKKSEFEVIDGQQRLTTLYLILECLNGARGGFTAPLQIFTLHFDKRTIQDQYLANKEYNNSTYPYQSNIDTFYLQKAFDIINDWMRTNFGNNGQLLNNYIDLLKAPPAGVKRPCVKVIWYEPSANKAISTFKNLNYGRIPLTGTELVKAILLADYGGVSESVTRSAGWDRMEKALQDPMFWSMLNNGKSSLSHIDFILDIVADKFDTMLQSNQQRSRERDKLMYNYYVIDSYIRQMERAGTDRKEIINNIWKEIEFTYNKVRNWYNNSIWFNYIGLWSRIGSCSVKDIVRLENGSTSKDELTEALRKEIKKALTKPKVVDLREKYEMELHILEASALNYEDDKGEKAMRKILLAFNVSTLIDHTSEDRFPFHLYDLYEETSLEHIHPQNINFNLTYSEIKSWTKERIKTIRALDKDELSKIKRDKEEIEKTCKRLEDELKENVWNKTEKCKEDSGDWKRISDDVNELDEIYGDMANISSSDMHRLCNMALVDKPTNSALSNKYLDEKRKILIVRNDERLKKEKSDTYSSDKKVDNAMYLMPATERAFSKFFTSEEGKHPLGNMHFWRKEDREAYFAAIKKSFDNFTK